MRKKELEQRVVVLESQVRDLREIVVTEEFEKLRKTGKRYEELIALLKDVRLRVKQARLVEGDDGSRRVVVAYQLPIISLELGENGEPLEKNPFFYAVNALELISEADYEKIRKALREAKAPKN